VGRKRERETHTQRDFLLRREKSGDLYKIYPGNRPNTTNAIAALKISK